MVDPQYVAEVMEAMRTITAGIPKATQTSVSPIPTVIPNKPIFERAGHAGETTLWVVFVLMLLSTLVMGFLSYKQPVQKRLFHVLTTFITAFATLSYFAMATGGGIKYAHFLLREEHKHVPTTVEHVYRQVYWARYADWSVTTPLLLLDLAFLASLNGADIIVALVADVVMILTGLFAANSEASGTRWGWYAMACLAYVVVLWILIVNGRRAASARSDGATTKLFSSIGLYTIVLWTLYPIVWALADGSRLITVDGEIIAYAILDVLAKPVFGFWLLFAHGRKIESLDNWWSKGLGSEGTLRLGEDD